MLHERRARVPKAGLTQHATHTISSPAAHRPSFDFAPGPAYVPPVHKRDQITLTGMRFHALVGVTGVCDAVRKPHVPLGGPLAYAEVVVDRGPTGAGGDA